MSQRHQNLHAGVPLNDKVGSPKLRLGMSVVVTRQLHKRALLAEDRVRAAQDIPAECETKPPSLKQQT